MNNNTRGFVALLFTTHHTPHNPQPRAASARASEIAEPC